MGAKNRDQLIAGTFSDQEVQEINEAVCKKYESVAATSPKGMFRYLTGREGALALGYPESVIQQIPDSVMESFCGVGHPFGLKDIAFGSHLLDIGCGGGCDVIVASKLLGDEGRVCGVDLTPAMIERARANCAAAGVNTIELLLVDSEKLPYPDDSFDVVISNGVINLSARKPELLKEICRVLRPGGRLQFADIVLTGELPPGQSGGLDGWAQ